MKASRIHKPKARPANATGQDAMAKENQLLKELIKSKRRLIRFLRNKIATLQGKQPDGSTLHDDLAKELKIKKDRYDPWLHGRAGESIDDIKIDFSVTIPRHLDEHKTYKSSLLQPRSELVADAAQAFAGFWQTKKNHDSRTYLSETSNLEEFKTIDGITVSWRRTY